MDNNHYFGIFIDESKENLQEMILHLLALEKDPYNIEIVNKAFRSAHTLKGMSAAMGYEDLATLIHQIENILDTIRNYKTSVSSELMDIIFSAVNDLEAMIEDISAGGNGKKNVSQIASQLFEMEERTEKSFSRQARPLNEQAPNKTIRVSAKRIDSLLNFLKEFMTDFKQLEFISREINHAELNKVVESIKVNSSEMQNLLLTMRNVPVEIVFNQYSKFVRQLSRGLGKQISLEITGSDTELDHTVIEKIGTPLMHLIRNAVDHGIENPEERLARGKAAVGTIKLKAFRGGSSVYIKVEDDGAGIAKKKVLQKAIDKGIITKETAGTLSSQQICALIMEPGLSTADEISDLSGRGVGLDVVKTSVESLGGSITIDSTEGSGVSFSIKLPLAN